MADRYDTILLFGPPGVGKGTQGHIVATIPGFYHSSTGDIFRNLDSTSEMGKLFFEYSSRGELVPDDVTLRIWHQTIYATTILGLVPLLGDVFFVNMSITMMAGLGFATVLTLLVVPALYTLVFGIAVRRGGIRDHTNSGTIE